MNRVVTTLLASLCLVTGYATFCTTADARGMGAFAGNAAGAGSSSPQCFSETNGGIAQNQCTSAPGWTVSLPVDSASAFTPSVYGSKSSVTHGGATLACNACVTSSTGMLSCNGRKTASGSDGAVTLNLGAITVPPNGYLFAACFMGQGTSWFSTTW
jgi:hypothetical protein